MNLRAGEFHCLSHVYSVMQLCVDGLRPIPYAM